jgi:hypothetical protein
MSNLRHAVYCQQCARLYIIDSVIEQSAEAPASRHHFLDCTGLRRSEPAKKTVPSVCRA